MKQLVLQLLSLIILNQALHVTATGCTQFTTLWGACRSPDGTTGVYTAPQCDNCTADKCMNLCTNSPGCIAFEFSPNGCELHTGPVMYANPNVGSGIKCGVCKSNSCPVRDASTTLLYATRRTVDADFGVKDTSKSVRENADSVCRSLIPEGHTCGLPQFKIRALVSIDANDEIADWPSFGYGTGAVYGIPDVDANRVANSWNDLLNGNIDHTLSSTGVLTNGYWWSGSNAYGKVLSDYVCRANNIPWSTKDGSSSYKVSYGTRDNTGSAWIKNTASGHCNSSSKRLLCGCVCEDTFDDASMPPTNSPTKLPTDWPTVSPTVYPTKSPVEAGCTEFTTLWGACRSSEGSYGTFVHGDCDGCTAQQCMNQCTYYPGCVAFEHSENRCELHTAPVMYAQPLSTMHKCGVCKTDKCPVRDIATTLLYATRRSVDADFGVKDTSKSVRENADDVCRSLIPEGHTCRLPQFKIRALVSIDANDEIADWPSFGYGTGAVYGIPDVDANRVANSWNDLLNGNIDHTLSSTGVLTNGYWWSGSDAYGKVLSDYVCRANNIPWSTKDGSSSYKVSYGTRDNTGSAWIKNTASGHCDSSSKRLLCGCVCEESITLQPTSSPTKAPTPEPCDDFSILWGKCIDENEVALPVLTQSNVADADECMNICTSTVGCTGFEWSMDLGYCKIFNTRMYQADGIGTATKCGVCVSGKCPLLNEDAVILSTTRTVASGSLLTRYPGNTNREKADAWCFEQVREGHICGNKELAARAMISLDPNDQVSDWVTLGIGRGGVYGSSDIPSRKIAQDMASFIAVSLDRSMLSANVIQSPGVSSNQFFTGSDAYGNFDPNGVCELNGVPWTNFTPGPIARVGDLGSTGGPNPLLLSGNAACFSFLPIICGCYCPGSLDDVTMPPTSSPTDSPTVSPTSNPTDSPTITPTDEPTVSPTTNPTDSPTITPTDEPTVSPTSNPTDSPSLSPSALPTASPTKLPTDWPTVSPTVYPTKSPVEAGCTEFTTLWGACRSSEGSYGTFVHGDCDGCTAQQCMNQCTYYPGCVAFEHSENRCELHTAPVMYAQPLSTMHKCGVCKTDKCPVRDIATTLLYATRRTVDADFGVKDTSKSVRENADDVCRSLIPEGHTCRLPQFKIRALVSIDANDEIADWPSFGYGTGAVYGIPDVDANRVANSWNDLLNGNIDHTLSSTGVLTNGYWWSGSDAYGKVLSDYVCRANNVPWSTKDGSSSYKVSYGTRDNTGSAWIKNTASGHCDSSSKRLLCGCVCEESITLQPTSSPTKAPTPEPCDDFSILWGKCIDENEVALPVLTQSNVADADECMNICTSTVGCTGFEWSMDLGYCKIFNTRMYQADGIGTATKCGVCVSGKCPLLNEDAVILSTTRTVASGSLLTRYPGNTNREKADAWCFEQVREGHICGNKELAARAMISLDPNDQVSDWVTLGIGRGGVYGSSDIPSRKIAQDMASFIAGSLDRSMLSANVIQSPGVSSNQFFTGSDAYGNFDPNGVCELNGVPWTNFTPGPIARVGDLGSTGGPNPLLLSGNAACFSFLPIICGCYCPGSLDDVTMPPTSSPTDSPTVSPTSNPTDSPTITPTDEPTVSPTTNPTDSPTITPTDEPTVSPTSNPTDSPSLSPSALPTASPTKLPTDWPTVSPTVYPTKSPVEAGCTEFTTLWGACRSSEGSYGTFVHGDCDGCTAQQCMNQCTYYPGCVAFEHSENRCELHTAPVMYAQPLSTMHKCGVCKTDKCPVRDIATTLLYATRRTVDADFGVKDTSKSVRENADDVCRSLIPEGHTCRLPQFKIRALVSIDANDEIADWPSFGYGTGAVYGIPDVDANRVANSWNDLLNGNIDHTLSSTGVLTNGYWWSGSDAYGKVLSDYVCRANNIPWSTKDGSSSYKVSYGTRDNTGSAWIKNTISGHCDSSSKRLLCGCVCKDSFVAPTRTQPPAPPQVRAPQQGCTEFTTLWGACRAPDASVGTFVFGTCNGCTAEQCMNQCTNHQGCVAFEHSENRCELHTKPVLYAQRLTATHKCGVCKSDTCPLRDDSSTLLYATSKPVLADFGVTDASKSVRENADEVCKNLIPEGHTCSLPQMKVRAFVSIDAEDQLASWPSLGFNSGPTFGLPDVPSRRIASSWNDLFDGTITQTLSSARILTWGSWWSGSDRNGRYRTDYVCLANGVPWSTKSPSYSYKAAFGVRWQTSSAWIEKGTSGQCAKTYRRLLCSCQCE